MIVLISILIILDALKDAFYDNGKKLVSGIIDIVYLSAMICGVVLMSGEWMWIVIYLLLRYAIFDLIYNLVRGLSLLYVGTTKPYDKVIRSIFNENAIHFLFITKLAAFLSAVTFVFII